MFISILFGYRTKTKDRIPLISEARLDIINEKDLSSEALDLM